MELTQSLSMRETKYTKPSLQEKTAHKSYYLPSLLERGRG